MATQKDKDPKVTRRQAENARAAIKVGNILTRLEKFVSGETDDEGNPAVIMTPAQVNAAKTLLGKVLPDMQQVETVGDEQIKSVAELRRELVAIIKADPSLATEALSDVEPDIKKAPGNDLPEASLH